MYLIDEENLGHTVISSKNIQTYRPISGGEKLWVARITGIDPKFGFSREFVRNEEDNFMPDIKICFFYLKAGFIYQYNNVYVDKGVYASGYFCVNECGEKIMSLTIRQVRKFLGMPVKDWKIEDITYADDNCPF